MDNSDKIQELNQKIEQELDKENPDINQIKIWRQEIRSIIDGVGDNSSEPEEEQAKILSVTEAEPEEEPSKSSDQPKGESYGGLNAILYIGSLLIIAGAGSLLAAAVSNAYKMIILLLIVTLFYGGGLAIRSNKKLKSAGNAFVGTALAIIPFLGFAFAGFTKLPGEISWLLTSLFGTLAYVVAAILMKSKVVAYFSMAFMISLACSAPACFHLHAIWCFFMIIMLGIIANLVSLATKNSKANVFSGVLNISGRGLPALTAITSLCVITITEPWFYALLFGLSSLNFLLIWLSNHRKGDEIIFRYSLQAFILALVYTFFNQDEKSTLIFGFAIGATFFIQAMVGVIIGHVKKEYIFSETVIIITSLAAVFMISLPIMYFDALYNYRLSLNHYMGARRGTVPVTAPRPDYQSALATVRAINLVWMTLTVIVSLLAKELHKKEGWVFGIIVPAIFAPVLLINGPIFMISGRLENSDLIYFFCYFAEFFILAAWAFLSSIEKNIMKIFSLITVTLIGFIMMANGAAYHTCFGVISMALIAAFWIALGIKNHQKGIMGITEVGIYIAAATLCYFTSWITADYLYPDHIKEPGLFILAASLHIIALALIGVDLWRKQSPRKVIAFIGLPIYMSFIAASSSNSIARTEGFPSVWTIVALIEDLAILYYGYMRRRQYLWNVLAIPLAIVVTTLISSIDPASDRTLLVTMFIHTASAVILVSSLIFKEQATSIIGVVAISATMSLLSLRPGATHWQILYLVEEVAILAISTLHKNKPIQIISAICVILAIMYYSREIPFVWLILLGFALIALVIHKLLKKDGNSQN